MALRMRPYAFLRVGNRWINLSMVTDIEDHGDRLVVFVASDMARLAGGEDPEAIDVARRFAVSDPADVDKLRKWLKLNDEE
jgi:hypothetical protein